jgi:hypothetical protein
MKIGVILPLGIDQALPQRVRIQLLNLTVVHGDVLHRAGDAPIPLDSLQTH